MATMIAVNSAKTVPIQVHVGDDKVDVVPVEIAAGRLGGRYHVSVRPGGPTE